MSKQKGVTMVEILITVAVIAILVGIGVPSFLSHIEKRRLIGAAELVYSQLAFAKTEAIKRSTEDIVVEFSANGSTTWAFGVTDKDSCDPTVSDVTNAAACTVEYDNDPAVDFDGDGNSVDPVLYRWSSDQFAGVVMATPSLGGNPRVGFDPLRAQPVDPADGSIANGRVSLTSPNYALDVVVSRLGRVKVCKPSGYSGDLLAGYRSC